jgi:hypothetical protein
MCDSRRIDEYFRDGQKERDERAKTKGGQTASPVTPNLPRPFAARPLTHGLRLARWPALSQDRNRLFDAKVISRECSYHARLQQLTTGNNRRDKIP